MFDFRGGGSSHWHEYFCIYDLEFEFSVSHHCLLSTLSPLRWKNKDRTIITRPKPQFVEANAGRKQHFRDRQAAGEGPTAGGLGNRLLFHD